MKNVKLHVPTVEDLWYREKCMSDPETMAYNAGYDVTYDGYHYDTGCIDFPKENHSTWFNNRMKNPNFFYAYIEDVDSREWVGYVNFNKDPETNKATMGIVIESVHQGKGYMRPTMKELIAMAEKKGVFALTDTVPETRKGALKVFYDLGFVKVGEENGFKFSKPEIVAKIELLIKENSKV